MEADSGTLTVSVVEMVLFFFCKHMKYTLEHLVVLVQIQEWQCMLFLI